MPAFTDSNDFLAASTILRRASSRHHFDPKNLEHQASLAHFIKTGNWTVQFFPEFPFTDVPMTVLMKFAMSILNVTMENRTKKLIVQHDDEYSKSDQALDRAFSVKRADEVAVD